MEKINSRCLVLNADYSPLTIVNWQRAITWALQKEHNDNINIEIIDYYKNDYIIGINKKYPIPAVIKTKKYYSIYNQHVNFSRKNIFIRDNYTCQYCLSKKEIVHLTYDHVIPKSLWKNKTKSPTNWTNIVTSCIDCNRKKGSRTPQQANMPLKTIPDVPQKSTKYLPVTHFLLKIRSDIPTEWMDFLSSSCI